MVYRQLKNNDNARLFVMHAYTNGIRIKAIQDILKTEFGVNISDKTLQRFVTANCESRYKKWHPMGKWNGRKDCNGEYPDKKIIDEYES